VTISHTAWKGKGEGPLLPRGVGDIKWLRCALKWDIEELSKEKGSKDD